MKQGNKVLGGGKTFAWNDFFDIQDGEHIPRQGDDLVTAAKSYNAADSEHATMGKSVRGPHRVFRDSLPTITPEQLENTAKK